MQNSNSESSTEVVDEIVMAFARSAMPVVDVEADALSRSTVLLATET